MFKGAPKGTTDYVIEDIRHFIEDLENKNKEILNEPKNVLIERNRITKELEEYNNIVVALKMAASLNLDLAAFRKLKRFYAEIFVIDSRDIEEVTKSLNELLVYSNKLNDEKSVVIVFGSNEDSERVTKVLRGFGYHPLQIPAHMPQNPSIAYAQSEVKVKDLEANLSKVSKAIEKIRASLLSKILSLHEAAKVAKDILEITRKPAGTKNFAMIQGYIPTPMKKTFNNLTKGYISVIEEAHFERAGEHAEILPSLLTNKSYIRTFEVITETQGVPNYDETDPTPIIAFVWPLFYGLMFADLGHGLLLFGLGMLLRQRGNGSIRTWGTLLAASGAAASLGGLLTGELFGFHLFGFDILAPFLKYLPFVG
ncbi:MAG TPA: V-type ATPase 116kDa subunit family protein, partial [Nitrososphaeraceae archaeon]|nr:V-type ATPase 116kDa subunit family protein [Nitrososphaeraceae archaeon]